MVDRLRMARACLEQSPRELAYQANEAFEEGDLELCIVLIDAIYDLFDKRAEVVRQLMQVDKLSTFINTTGTGAPPDAAEGVG